MTNNEYLHADMLDILFEHRNKNYGAYALRKNYNSRMTTALIIALSVVIILILFSFLNKNSQGNSTIRGLEDSVVLKSYQMTPEPEKPIEKPKAKIKEVRSSGIIQIVPNNMATNMPEQNEIINAIVGTENVDGKPLIDPNEIVNSGPGIEGNKIPVEQEPETNFIPKEIPPSFPGGVDAWLSFLRKYLQTPEELETGQKVVVRIRFWIDADGSLSRFEVIQSGGSAFEKEVLRVMKKMPKWESAIQNNSRVAVAYTQPVIFVGEED